MFCLTCLEIHYSYSLSVLFFFFDPRLSVLLMRRMFVSARVKTVGSGFAMCLETEDVKAAVAKAVSAGAVSEGELAEGEGEGLVRKLKDPYGFVWTVCSPTKKSVDVDVVEA